MKKILALLLVLVFLVATLSGCGSKQNLPGGGDEPGGQEPGGEEPGGQEPGGEEPGGEEPGGQEPVELEGDQVVIKGNVFYPEDYLGVLNTFTEFGYVYREVAEDGTESSWSVHYVSEGIEEVDGIEAQVIHLTKVEGSTDEYRLLFDSGWDCIKAEMNGEELDSWTGSTLTILMALYVNYIKLTTAVLAEDGSIDTSIYKFEGKSSETTEIGALEVYSFSTVWSTSEYHYGFKKDGDLYFGLIRTQVPGTKVLSELRVTHFNRR